MGADEIHWGRGLKADNFLTVIYQIDKHCRRLTRLSGCLQAGKVDYSLQELLAQRVFGVACRLVRDPIQGRDLASQPALSRFENGVGPGTFEGMDHAGANDSARLTGGTQTLQTIRPKTGGSAPSEPAKILQNLDFLDTFGTTAVGEIEGTQGV